MTLPVQETESKAAFTRGPWSLNPHCQRLVNGGANRREVAKTSFGPDDDKAENTANAVLISAAPELYEALEDWLAYAEENLSEFDYEDCHAEKLCHRCESSGCINLKIRNARSALLKAQGNQP
jgi:hypothetical protein